MAHIPVEFGRHMSQQRNSGYLRYDLTENYIPFKIFLVSMNRQLFIPRGIYTIRQLIAI